MTYFKFVGGGSDLFRIFAERRQALGIGLSPRLPKGGQRRSPKGRLIDSVGGDSYGK